MERLEVGGLCEGGDVAVCLEGGTKHDDILGGVLETRTDGVAQAQR